MLKSETEIHFRWIKLLSCLASRHGGLKIQFMIYQKKKKMKKKSVADTEYPKVILKYRKLPLKFDMQWYTRREDTILSPGNQLWKREDIILSPGNQLWKVLSKAISKYFWFCGSLFLVKRNSRINVVDSNESNVRFGNVTCRGIFLMKKIEGKNKRIDENNKKRYT